MIFLHYSQSPTDDGLMFGMLFAAFVY